MEITDVKQQVPTGSPCSALDHCGMCTVVLDVGCQEEHQLSVHAGGEAMSRLRTGMREQGVPGCICYFPWEEKIMIQKSFFLC